MNNLSITAYSDSDNHIKRLSISMLSKVIQDLRLKNIFSIHIQIHAQAEIERMRVINRANYAHRKQRMREDMEYSARHHVAHSEAQKIFHNKKRIAIEDDPLHVNIRKNVDRMARVRRMAREI